MMRFRYLQVVSIIFTLNLIVVSCKEAPPKQAIETPEVTFSKEGELKIYKAQSDSILANFDIEFAESDYETQTGLMYRKGMMDKQGMLFIFEDSRLHSFYMKNTEFPIDILFIDDQLKIVTIKENAQPLDETGISSVVPIQYVLEVNSGQTEKLGLTVGDSISFSRQ